MVFEWVADGKFGLFTLYSARRDAIDHWIEQIIELRRSYPPDQPLLLAHDNSRLSLTPYARHALQTLATHPVQHQGRSAIIIGDGVIERGVVLLVNRNLQQVYKGLERGRCFNTLAAAFQWLREANG